MERIDDMKKMQDAEVIFWKLYGTNWVCENYMIRRNYMRFFIVNLNNNYVPPYPKEWYGILDEKSLSRKRAFQMPKHLLFPIENNMQTVITDIIMFPVFMVTEMVMEVIKKYDPFLPFVRVIFFDRKNKRSMVYYLPFLEELECICKKENADLVLDKEKIVGKVIGKVKDKKSKTHIVMRMDLTESILRRNAVG